MHALIIDHFQHLSFDLSRSLKVKYDCGIGFPIYDFLLVYNSNIWLNSAALQDTKLRNLNDFEFDFSRSFKVKCGGVFGLPIYGCLLIYI